MVRGSSDDPGSDDDGSEGSPAWPTDPVEILRILYPRLREVARSLGAGEDTEDLVQDALVETLRRHPDFQGLAFPFGYVQAVMVRRRFSRRRRGISQRVSAEVLERLETAAPDPAEASDERARISQDLAVLGARQRTCVVLHYLYGLGDAQIASLLGCRLSTVRSQISRGLARLRAHPREEGDEWTVTRAGDGSTGNRQEEARGSP